MLWLWLLCVCVLFFVLVFLLLVVVLLLLVFSCCCRLLFVCCDLDAGLRRDAFFHKSSRLMVQDSTSNWTESEKKPENAANYPCQVTWE